MVSLRDGEEGDGAPRRQYVLTPGKRPKKENGKPVDRAGHAAHTTSPDQPPRDGTPIGTGRPARGVERRAFAKTTRYRSLHGAGATARMS